VPCTSRSRELPAQGAQSAACPAEILIAKIGVPRYHWLPTEDGGADLNLPLSWRAQDRRVPCTSCGRKFLPEALQKHARICAKVFASKRKVFNPAKQRLQVGVAGWLLLPPGRRVWLS